MITSKKYYMDEDIPYDGAKYMYLVNDVDDKDKLNDIVIDTYNGL